MQVLEVKVLEATSCVHLQKLLPYQMLKEGNENRKGNNPGSGRWVKDKDNCQKEGDQSRHQWHSDPKRVLSPLPGDGENRSLFAWIH